MTQRDRAVDRAFVPHAVSAMLHLAGPQPTNITMQHPGTQEATIAVSVRRCVMYLNSQATAEGVERIWRDAAVEALAFPSDVGTSRPRYRRAAPLDAAEPSIVVHTYGRPAGFVRLASQPGGTAFLHVQIGGLTFFFHDKASFESVSGAFLRAAELGAQHLPRVDLRKVGVIAPLRPPGLDGYAAAEAREHLERIARHPARIAAASLEQLENQLAAMVGPLQEALARTRAIRQTGERTASSAGGEQSPNRQGVQRAAGRQRGGRSAAERSVPEQQAPPARVRRDGTGGSRTGEQHQRGGRTR